MTAWVDKFIKVNQYSRPAAKLNGVRKAVLHYTANNGASAQNHFNYFNDLEGRYASAHLFVDWKEALCIIPLNEIAYHCNDGKFRDIPELRPNGNFLSIGVEMCLEKDGSFHPETIRRTEDVFVELCKKYNLDPIKDIVRHFDITRKNCPAPWVANEKEFIAFKNRVKVKMNPIPVKSAEVKQEQKGDDDKLNIAGTVKTQMIASLAKMCDKNVHGDKALSKVWVDKLKKDEMTISEAVALFYIGKDRGLF